MEGQMVAATWELWVADTAVAAMLGAETEEWVARMVAAYVVDEAEVAKALGDLVVVTVPADWATVVEAVTAQAGKVTVGVVKILLDCPTG
jgi:putative heme iron utilization protein